jgi:putative oxygen-independent coproporphyrinogen III oxidase
VSVGALYLHVPFCVRRCRYCDFATAATRRDDPVMREYVGALERLAGEACEIGLLGGARTAYIGGGTPSLLGDDGISRLVRSARGAGELEELSFEANPESLSDEALAAAAEAGATRVSIGVQSLNDAELKAIGRVHDAALARERVSAAVESGLHVSCDLMCGLPYQTAESWQASLDGALELGVGHVSCYPLMIEEGTPLERMCEAGEMPWPSDDTEAEDMEAAERVLGAAGFSRYEVASYARPGERCLHNIAYWTGVEYLGLGRAAASMLSRESYNALRMAASDLPELDEGTVRVRLTVASTTSDVAKAHSLADLEFELEELNAREAVAEDLMLAARMSDGIPADLLARADAVLGERNVSSCVDTLANKGLLKRVVKGSFVPTHAGWLLGNELYGPLWGLASED